MSSGPSVSWLHPAFSCAKRSSAIVRSVSTEGSAFSWIVSEADVCRMNSVTAPSVAPASRRNFSTSEVRLTKPVPDVCTDMREVTMRLALIVEDGERDIDLLGVTFRLSTRRPRDPATPTAFVRRRTSAVEPLRRWGSLGPPKLQRRRQARGLSSQARFCERRQPCRLIEKSRSMGPGVFAGTASNRSELGSDLPRDVLLHPVGNVDQAAP